MTNIHNHGLIRYQVLGAVQFLSICVNVQQMIVYVCAVCLGFTQANREELD